jgi:hypothetical protein
MPNEDSHLSAAGKNDLLVDRQAALLLGSVTPMIPLIAIQETVFQAMSSLAIAASSAVVGFFDAVGDGSIPPDAGIAIVEKWMNDLDNSFQNAEGKGVIGAHDRCVAAMRQAIENGIAEILAVLEDEANGKISHSVAEAKKKFIRSIVARAEARAMRCMATPEPLPTVSQVGGGGEP